ncbi:MAG TPA: hypothetical protein VGT61_08575 [Thermomicrobiales bacterium]|nr:hypothetical protein [Thermomicrobiales bacterium]
MILGVAERAGLITDVVKPTPEQIAERVECFRCSAERYAAREAEEHGGVRAEAADQDPA